MSDAIRLAAVAPHGHWVVRARPTDHERLLGACAWPRPERMLTACTAGMRSTLWLGPDELLLVDERTDARDRRWPALEVSHSCVDVSARQVAFDLRGEEGPDLLAGGCPLDLHPSAFPVGACTRTVLGKCELVVWRRARDHLRLECWPSFAPYVVRFLEMS